MTKHFPTRSSGLDRQKAMSLDVTDKVAALSGLSLQTAGAEVGIGSFEYDDL